MHKFNNCVKVQFEIGHEASLRSEVTPQGFTHDWQVFVRGADNTEIHHFVEKVVFHLHESFPKPKRVVKEPPYEVKESGYASFTFPIEVYLKTKDEPRKWDFIYDLSLNTSGPIRTSQREKRLFNNPSEEFRRKLIRGGGVGVGSDMLPLTDNNSQNTDDKSSSKKSSSDSTKKHKSKDSIKPDELRSSNQFADLFGTPIKTAKLSPTTAPKKASESKHSSDTKVSSKSTSKHSPHKEKEKDKESSKKDTMITSSSKEKDRDRNKEKEKKADKSLKRPLSPVAVPAQTKVIKEEPKKSSHEETKEKEKVKSSSSDISKNEKKDKKKDKKSRDEKDKKDRHKDHEIKKEIPPVPAPQPPPPPVVEKEKDKIVEKQEKNKSEFREMKENVKKSPKNIITGIKEEKIKERVEKDKIESVEKQRHKHKKKEKNKKEEKEPKEKDKDKSIKKIEKLPPAPPVIPKEPSPPPQPPPKSRVRSPSPKLNKGPLDALLAELPPSDKGSDSESSADEDARSVEKVKVTPPPPPPSAPTPPVAQTPERVKEEKFIKEKVKKKEKKSSSKDEDGTRKKKRKIKEKEEAVPEKILKTKSDEEHKIIRDEHMDEDVDDRLSEPSSLMGSPQREDQEISRSRSPTPSRKFTDEYVMELKDLQQKIMTLEDNAELQRVVQVIAETGLYEITKKTFDFDLCALDKSTVKRLQDLFFAAS